MPETTSDSATQASRPVERRANIPDLRLSVDGKDFTPHIRRALDRGADGAPRPRLISLTLIEKRDGEADELQLVLDDSDGKLAIPKKGVLLRLQLGWLQGADVTPGLVDKGRFTVDQVEWRGPPDTITITARSADLTAGFRTRREAAHKDTTLGAIARKVAAANGLEAKVAAELDGIAVAIVAQHNQSDMALLRRLGREHDAVATVKDRKLILSPIGKATSPGGKALPGLTITRRETSDYTYREIERSAEAGVEARWHDPASAERKTVTVGGSGAGGSGGKTRRLRKVYHSEADARAAAQAEANRAKRGAAEFSLSLPLGRPDIYPERPVTLSGFKPQADGRKWIVREVTHTLGDRALVTSVALETV